MFPGFLTPVLTQLFSPNPPTVLVTYFCRGERRIYARKKVCLNRRSNSQPPCHESDTLTNEPSQRVTVKLQSTGEKKISNRDPDIFIVAPHERRHHIFIRFWKAPREEAILFAGSRLASPSLSLGLFVSRDCPILY